MKHKVYVNNDAIEVGKDTVTARELVELTGRKGSDYRLELRDGPHGPLLKRFSGNDIIDLDKECGKGGAPGEGPEGSTVRTAARTEADRAPEGPEGDTGSNATSTEAGGSDDAPGEGPEDGGTAHTTVDDAPCYFVTDYTGSINPA